MTRPADPWERQPGESDPAWQAFELYRNQQPGERSYRRVAQELGKSGSLTSRWASTWHWVDRTIEWDREQDRQARVEILNMRKAAIRRQARLAGTLMNQLIPHLQVAASGQSVEPRVLRELAATLESAARVERAALGIGDRVELTGADGGPVEVSPVSAEERQARLRELSEELTRRLGTDSDRTMIELSPGAGPVPDPGNGA
jgi:hypothetical protein